MAKLVYSVQKAKDTIAELQDQLNKAVDEGWNLQQYTTSGRLPDILIFWKLEVSAEDDIRG